MLKLLLASSAIVTVLILSQPAKSAIIATLPDNPTSQTGNFTSAPGAGPFEDQVVFGLSGGPQFLTIANATNTFAAPGDEILNWTAAIWSAGPNGTVNDADDVLLFGPQAATPCIGVSNCQAVGGSGVIDLPGTYYAEFIGIGSGTSGYGGNISTFAVPAPQLGGGLPGLVAAIGGWFGWRRWRKPATAT